jgi:hypothetical protein
MKKVQPFSERRHAHLFFGGGVLKKKETGAECKKK